MNTAQSSGIYIHVPFCLRKCRYCDFYSITRTDLIPDFTAAVLREMEMPMSDFPPADTLYFGGGTPSLLPNSQLARLIEKAVFSYDLPPDAEITLEMNPANLRSADIAGLKAMGVNRLNIGIQSFQSDQLVLLGRLHSPQQAVDCFKAARRAGFENLGFDLIFGLPGQSPAQWRRDLLQAMDLNPEHLSCYILSYEPGTPLFEAAQHGDIQCLGEDSTADLFHLAHDLLCRAGYDHYEVSNYARPGFRSRHNRKYWTFHPYLGLGPAAHSYLHPKRWWNSRSLQRYLEDVRAGRAALGGQETLTNEQQVIEEVYLGLRQSEGVDLPEIGRGLTPAAGERLEACLRRWQNDGLANRDHRRCRLTTAGMLLLDHLAAEMTAAME